MRSLGLHICKKLTSSGVMIPRCWARASKLVSKKGVYKFGNAVRIEIFIENLLCYLRSFEGIFVESFDDFCLYRTFAYPIINAITVKLKQLAR